MKGDAYLLLEELPCILLHRTWNNPYVGMYDMYRMLYTINK